MNRFLAAYLVSGKLGRTIMKTKTDEATGRKRMRMYRRSLIRLGAATKTLRGER